VKRLLITAVAITVTLTACRTDSTIQIPIIQHSYWSISIGLTAGDILSPLDGIDIEETLRDAWNYQKDQLLLEDARILAEDVAAGLPELIDISISMISIPGFANGRPSISEYGAGGFIATLLGALQHWDLNYIIQGSSTSCDELFFITMEDGEELEVHVEVLDFYLRLKRPAVVRSYSSITQFGEPRWDPPVMLEKRAGSRPGW